MPQRRHREIEAGLRSVAAVEVQHGRAGTTLRNLRAHSVGAEAVDLTIRKRLRCHQSKVGRFALVELMATDPEALKLAHALPDNLNARPRPATSPRALDWANTQGNGAQGRQRVR